MRKFAMYHTPGTNDAKNTYVRTTYCGVRTPQQWLTNYEAIVKLALREDDCYSRNDYVINGKFVSRNQMIAALEARG